MSRRIHTIYINFTGGIISPGHLHETLQLAAAAGVTDVRLGLRQQLLMDIPASHFKQFSEQCEQQGIAFHEQETAKPNITSSYPGAGIFITDGWLSEGVYKDVFDLFDYTPALKINICDSRQTFAPLFTGHINWVAAAHAHYWHLFIRLPGTDQLLPWPELVYTNHIARVSRCIEALLQNGITDVNNLHVQTKNKLEYTGRPGTELALPPFYLPYYEGFNRYQNGYWLGIYRRDEKFPLSFLQELCAICLETRTGQLYATSWKTIIIKNIDPAHRHLWDYVLGKYRINVRHAANELNWQVEDNSEDGLILKRHIIRHFDVADVRTYGLCFSIRMQGTTGHFGSVVIRRQESKYSSKLKYLQRYDILYTPGFNPNTATLLLYREEVAKEHLGPYLVSLCKEFYEQGSATNALQAFVSSRQATIAAPLPDKKVHQCRQCLSVYDETLGEPAQDIAPGTPFESLPPHFGCALCGAPASCFKEISEKELGVAASSATPR